MKLPYFLRPVPFKTLCKIGHNSSYRRIIRAQSYSIVTYANRTDGQPTEFCMEFPMWYLSGLQLI